MGQRYRALFIFRWRDQTCAVYCLPRQYGRRCGRNPFVAEHRPRNVDQQFGTVHFATSCNETAQRRFDRAMRYQHSFWYKASKEIFEGALKADPECGIAYWGIALGLVDNPHLGRLRPTCRSVSPLFKSEGDGRQDAARTRLYRRAGPVVCRL